MDPLDCITDAELLLFFHQKKTEISCIKQPHRLLTQLRDYDLVPENRFEKMKKMHSRKQKEKGFYEILDALEKKRPQDIQQFWSCVFEDHILQQYPTLRKLRSSLLDGTFKTLDGKTLPEEKSEEKAEKGKERNYKRKRSKDDKSTFKTLDGKTLSEEKSEEKAEKGKERKYKRKRSKDERSTSSLFEKPVNVKTLAEEESEGKAEEEKEGSTIFSSASPVKKGDEQEIWTWPLYKAQLPVTCGDKEGTLDRDKLAKGEKCILSERCWFTPNQFEKFGGKEKNKNWKFSIRCGEIPLKKLIKEGHLQCPQKESKKKTCVKKNMNKRFPVSSNKKSSADFQEQGERGEGTELRERADEEEEEEVEEEEMADLSVFQALSLPVNCGSLTGTLYKYRFASGSRGKCIRTEKRWFTPEEFVKQELTLTDRHWKKDILCHGKTLNFLIKKDVLCIHSLLCECVKCSLQEQDMMYQDNDDKCYVCRSKGRLVCCDECPRAFHSDCHLPAVHGDSPGVWICTFCVLRNSQQWRYPTQNMYEQEAFDAPVSQYKLHCHYLLLCVYREDIQKVFVKDPRPTVPKYSEFITQPMWLDRIKQKLESGQYQTVQAFVSDFQLLFSNYSKFNRGNKCSQMGARLKQMFEEEFRKIFKIAETFTPEITKGNGKDKHKNVYSFVCPHGGQFRCSLTSLLFVMEGEGEVSYNTESWDPRLLDGLGGMQPAGPLYNINCSNGSISGLHLPHCEIFSEDDMDCLAVAHFTGGNVAIMNPLKVTEDHVMIDIKDLSLFGLIKSMIFPPSPVVAQVLVFLRPVTVRQKENILDVHLLPLNVPVSEVKDQHTENTHIKTSSKCCLDPGAQYRLCCQIKGSTVQPATEKFELNFGPNYHPTFEVFVNIRLKEVMLSLKDNTDGCEVWVPRRILLKGQDVELPAQRRHRESEFVNKHRCQLVDRVSSVKQIADSLQIKRMITREILSKVHVTKPHQEQMRILLGALNSKRACKEFYRLLKKNEPYLVEELESEPSTSQ